MNKVKHYLIEVYEISEYIPKILIDKEFVRVKARWNVEGNEYTWDDFYVKSYWKEIVKKGYFWG